MTPSRCARSRSTRARRTGTTPRPCSQLRETVVRAFVETPPGAPDERVTGRLIGRRDGVELPGSPLVATNASGSVLARNSIVNRRGVIEDSLNFELPLAWTRGGESSSSSTPAARPWTARSPPTRARRPTTAASTRRSTRSRRSASRSSASTSTAPGRTGTTSPSRPRACSSALPVSEFNTTCALAGLQLPAVDRRPQRRPAQHARDRAHVLRAVRLRDASPRDVYYGLLDGPAVGGLNGKANGIPGDAASSFTNRLTGPTSSGYARNTVAHELSHTLGVHHAVDNARGISGGFLWWGGNKTGHCGEVASKDAAPGHTPFITVDGNTRPGLGPIDNADDEVWGVDSRFARADENDLGLSDPEVQVRADELLLRRRRAVPLVVGVRARPADRRHPRSAPSPAGAAVAAEVAVAGTPARSTPQADVVVPPAGSRGVLISGTVSANGQVRDDRVRVLPMPYPGDAAPGTRRLHAARRGRRGRAARRAPLHADGPLRRRRRGRPAVGDFAETIAIPAAARRSARSSSATGRRRIGSRTAAAGAAPTAGDVTISDPSIERDPVTLSWKRSAGSVSAVLLLARRRQVVAAARVPRRRRVARDRPEDARGHRRTGRFAVATSDGLRGAVAELTGVTVSVSNAAPTADITSPRPEDPSPSGLQPIVFTVVAGDRDQTLGDDADRVDLRPRRRARPRRDVHRRCRPAQRGQAHDHRDGDRRPGRHGDRHGGDRGLPRPAAASVGRQDA